MTEAAGHAVLVTGSSRGIGYATAVALAERGFAVAVNGPDDDQELQSAADAVAAASGGKVAKIVGDVSDVSKHDALIDEAEAGVGLLTTLVNNAGVSVLHRGDVLDVSEDSYDRCMAVNAKAHFFLTQRFARRLLSRGLAKDLFHSIVSVTSSNATAVSPNRTEYCASKAAAAMIAQAFAVRLGREGVAVYDIRPGIIESDMTRSAKDEYKRRISEGLTLVPRIGQPEDVGRIIATLATGQLPYTTGQVIAADAGMLVPRF